MPNTSTSERSRIRGRLGERMVDAALKGLHPDFTWGGGNYGINWPGDDWRWNMRRALEAAFDELLKEPLLPPGDTHDR